MHEREKVREKEREDIKNLNNKHMILNALTLPALSLWFKATLEGVIFGSALIQQGQAMLFLPCCFSPMKFTEKYLLPSTWNTWFLVLCQIFDPAV